MSQFMMRRAALVMSSLVLTQFESSIAILFAVVQHFALFESLGHSNIVRVAAHQACEHL